MIDPDVTSCIEAEAQVKNTRKVAEEAPAMTWVTRSYQETSRSAVGVYIDWKQGLQDDDEVIEREARPATVMATRNCGRDDVGFCSATMKMGELLAEVWCDPIPREASGGPRRDQGEARTRRY